MNLAAEIIVGVFVLATAALVIGMFVWAAVRDGQDETAFCAGREEPPLPD
jgi:hypothetical protein